MTSRRKVTPLAECIRPAVALFLLLTMQAVRYHGMSPILSRLYHDGYMEAVALEQTRCLTGNVCQTKLFFRSRICHAIRAAIGKYQMS